MEIMRNKHLGSSFDEFLEEEGLSSEVEAVAIERVLTIRIGLYFVSMLYPTF